METQVRAIRFGNVAAGLAVVFMAVTLVAPPAVACGVSTADGLSSCSLQEHEEATRPRWRVGASAVYTSTTIEFGGLHSDETRGSVVASLAYQPSRRVTLQLAAGSTLGGRLDTPVGRYDFSPGPTTAIGASWRLLGSPRPFVLLTSNLSFSATTTQLNGTGAKASYDAFDLRLGALVGTTIAEVLNPYAVARLFGGPIYWQYQGASVTGTDAHHYQLGAGLTVVIAHRVNAFLEGIPLGERSFAGGAGVAF